MLSPSHACGETAFPFTKPALAAGIPALSFLYMLSLTDPVKITINSFPLTGRLLSFEHECECEHGR